MAETIVFIPNAKINWRVLLHQTLERENIDAVVLTIRADDKWSTAWSSMANSSLSMAGMKQFHDILNAIEDND